MANDQITAAVAQLLHDLSARTAAQSPHQVSPERATTISRRPNVTVPPVSPRAVQLFTQIMNQRPQQPALPPSADANAAVQQVSDRASLLAQQADNPNSPINVTAPTPPQYISSPNLRIRGNPDDPAQQTRQYAAPLPSEPPPAVQPGPGVTGGSFTPQQAMDMFLNSPAASTMDPASFASAYAKLYHELTTTPSPAPTPPPEQQAQVNAPKPSLDQAPLTPEQTKTLDQFVNSPAAQMMDPAQFDSAYARLYSEVVPQQELPQSTVGGALNRGWENVRHSPPGEAAAYGVGQFMDLANSLQYRNQKQMADEAYYMMTHDGEFRDLDMTDPGSVLLHFWLDDPTTVDELRAQVGKPTAPAMFGPPGAETDAQWQALGPQGQTEWLFGTSGYEQLETPARQMVDSPLAPANFTGTPEQWQAMSKGQRVMWVMDDSSGGVLSKATMMTYLRDHPEKWDAAKQAYADGGADGLYRWYEEDAGPWWSFASSLIMDPLNWALGLGVVGKGVKWEGLQRAVNAGEDVNRARQGRALQLGGEALNVASDPLINPIEKLWKGGGWALKRIPGVGPGRAATERTVTEGVQEGADIAAGMGSEEQFTRVKNQAGEAASRQAAADAAKQAAVDEKNAAVQAAKDERAAEAEIRQAIKDGDKQRADDLRRQEQANKVARDNEAKAAAVRKQKADDAYAFETKIEERKAKAQVDRDTQLKNAKTDAQRTRIENTYQGKIDKANIEREAQIARWERKHNASYADEMARSAEAAPTPPPVESVPTETPPVSSVASEAQTPVSPLGTAAETAPITPDVPRAPESVPAISVDTTRTVARGGELIDEPITHSYYDASYSTPEKPNLARMVDDTYGPTNPEAAQRFHAAYDPMAREQMRLDEELRNTQVRSLDAQGLGVTPSRLDTRERALMRSSFDAQSEALFELHFGHGSGRDLFQFDTRAGRMSPTDPRSWIEHALNGNNEADHAAAIARIRAHPSPIMIDATDPAVRQLNNDQLANRLEKRWRELVGEAPAAPFDQAALPTPTEPNPLPDNIQAVIDEYRADILSADADLSRAAAARAHQFEKAIPRELRGEFRRQINELRDQSGHVTSRSPKPPREPRTGPGIVLDPKNQADQLFQSTKNGLGRVIKRINPLNPAEEVRDVNRLYVNGVVRDDILNGDELLRRVNAGEITSRQADVLLKPTEMTVKVGNKTTKTTTNFWNRLQENIAKESSKTRRAIEKSGFPADAEEQALLRAKLEAEYDNAILETVNDLTPEGQREAVMRRTIHKIMGSNRSYIQFNVITGPRAAFMDVVGNTKLAFVAGEGGASRYVPQLMWNFIKDDLDEVKMLDLPLFDAVRQSGVKYLPTDLSHNIGREEVARNLGKRPRVPSPINSYWIKRVRGANDNAFRHAIYLNKFGEEIAPEQGRFLDFVRAKKAAGKVPQDMYDEIEALVRDRFNAGTSFSPDEIRTITRQYVTDDSFARTWAKQVDDVSARANKAQQTVMFTYKKTKIDDAIGKVFLFHYYMTRSTPLYLKIMLQHPQLISMEHQLWQATDASIKSHPGTPAWLHGFVGFGLQNGHVLWTNPITMLSGISVFQSLGDGGFSKSRLEDVTNSSGLFLNPMWKQAGAIAGYFGATDPTGTTQIRRAVTNMVDAVRFSDFGREHGWDKIDIGTMEPGMPTPDFVQDIINGVSEIINDGLQKVQAPVKEFDESTSLSKKQNAIRGILITNAKAEGWDDTRLITAQEDLLSGTPNPDVDAAVNEYVDIQVQSSAASMVLPGGTVRDAATDQRQAEEKAAKAVPYDQRTPEQQAQVDTRDVSQIKSPEGVALASGMNAYNAAGDQNQKNIEAGRRVITQDYMDVPDDHVMILNGRTITGRQLKNMDDAEREQLANEWAADQMTQAGMAAGARVAGPDYLKDNPNAAYQQERQRVAAAHPEIQDYLDYRSWTYKQLDDGTLPETIQGMLAQGDTEFARAYHRQEDYLRSQGLSGPELEDRLVQWVQSEQGYAALMGWKWIDNADPGAPSFTINHLPPWREEVGSPTGTAKDTTTKDSSQLRGGVEDVGMFIRDRARDYNAAKYPYRRKKPSSTSGVGSGPLSYLLADYTG